MFHLKYVLAIRKPRQKMYTFYNIALLVAPRKKMLRFMIQRSEVRLLFVQTLVRSQQCG